MLESAQKLGQLCKNKYITQPGLPEPQHPQNQCLTLGEQLDSDLTYVGASQG